MPGGIGKKIGEIANAIGIFSRATKGGMKRVNGDIVELKFPGTEGMSEGEVKVRSLKCWEKKS